MALFENNEVRRMRKRGIIPYGTKEDAGIKIKVPSGKANNVLRSIGEGGKRIGRGLIIMGEGMKKAGNTKTGRGLKKGLGNMYKNFYK